MTAAVSYRSVPTLLDVTALLSNLARFAQMRASRPQPTPDATPADVLWHLYAVRDWARAHDHSRCYCATAGTCPACSLRQCDACDAELADEQPCARCLQSGDEWLDEERDVALCERRGAL